MRLLTKADRDQIKRVLPWVVTQADRATEPVLRNVGLGCRWAVAGSRYGCVAGVEVPALGSLPWCIAAPAELRGAFSVPTGIALSVERHPQGLATVARADTGQTATLKIDEIGWAEDHLVRHEDVFGKCLSALTAAQEWPALSAVQSKAVQRFSASKRFARALRACRGEATFRTEVPVPRRLLIRDETGFTALIQHELEVERPDE